MKNYRIYTFLLFALFISISAIAQHKIVSVEYVSPTSAILTRNNPPPGVTYYWQGTICSNNPTNSALTYTAHTSSTYYLNAFYSSGSTWSTSCASTIVFFPDVTAPVLVYVTVGPIEPGTDVSVTTNEDGMVYLVPNGTLGILGDILAAKVAEASVTEYVASTMATTGLALGEYVVFAVDGSNNVSTSSGVIEFADMTAPVLSGVSAGPIDIGNAISATSNENGMIYLVPEGTGATVGAITSAKVSEAAATAGVAVSLATTGIAAGNYIVYAVDGSDNVSTASAVIAVQDPADVTAPVLSGVSAGPIDIGNAISATSNENGMIYLVPEGTGATIGAITSAKVSEAAATAGVAVSLATTGIASGNYIVYAVDGSDNVSTASAAIVLQEPADVTAPVLSGVSTGPIDIGNAISATSNENGMIYLVPEGTGATVGAITSAKVSEAAATAGVAVSLATTGIAAGNYIVYAVDGSDNVSTASAVIAVQDPADVTAPVLSGVSAGPIDIGDPISATSNENGMIYLVPEGTGATVGAITSAKVSEAAATAGVAVSLATTGVAAGNYIVYAVDASDNVSTASAVIAIQDAADVTAPVLSGVSAGPIIIGDAISATSNEDGMIYLVPAGTAATTGAITSAKVSEATATAGVTVSLATTGISPGSYIVYAIDGSDNVSLASAAIAINTAAGDGLNTMQSASVLIYPPYVEDILNIKSEIQVSSIFIYSINGTLVMSVNNPSDQISMSGLNEGIYIIKVHLSDKSTFAGKVIKK